MNILNQLGLKAKFISSILAVTLLTIAITYIVVISYQTYIIKREFIRKAESTASIVGSVVAEDIINHNSSSISHTINKITDNNKYLISVSTADGALLAHAPISEKPAPTETGAKDTITAEHYRLSRPIMTNSNIIGWVSIHGPTKDYTSQINDIVSFTSFLAAGLLLISFIYAFLFLKFLTNPLSNLKHTIQKLYENRDYSIRLNWHVSDEIGKLYESFNQLVQQIQERETERDIAEAKLIKSENKFRYLAEQLPQTIFEADSNGKLSYLNIKGKQIFSLTDDDIKQGIRLQNLIALSAETESELQKLQDTDEDKGVIAFDSLATIKEDKTFHASVFINYSRISDKVVNLSGIIIDNTERIAFEQELKQSKAKAEESDRLKSAFLANMSHEIRTPMNSIIGFADMLTDPELREEEKNEFISYINSSSKSLINIIDDIIDIAKIEAGQISITNKEFNIVKMLNEIGTHLLNEAKRADKSNIRIQSETSLDSNRLMIYTDPLRLKQILNNLLINALKFTDKGEIKFGFTIEKSQEGDYLKFFVKDTGIGIPETKKEAIFERFNKLNTNKDRIYGGTGLGLTISKNLVKILGGSIYVESEFGVGSTFYFTIPLHQKRDMKTEPNTSTKKQAISGDWHNYEILVAEDEETNFQFIKAALKRTKVKLSWVTDGKKAVDAISGHDYDLILMDIKMPEMNGLEATQAIREFNKDIPIIAQTAYALSGEREKCYSAGCSDYLTKPIKAKDLIKTIEKNFRHREAVS